MGKKNENVKYFEDAEYNTAFIRCIDLLAGLIEKYADKVLTSVEGLDYVVQVQGIDCIIDVTSAPYREELFRQYYGGLFSGDSCVSVVAA